MSTQRTQREVEDLQAVATAIVVGLLAGDEGWHEKREYLARTAFEIAEAMVAECARRYPDVKPTDF